MLGRHRRLVRIAAPAAIAYGMIVGAVAAGSHALAATRAPAAAVAAANAGQGLQLQDQDDWWNGGGQDGGWFGQGGGYGF
jgi:hypothetical protein